MPPQPPAPVTPADHALRRLDFLARAGELLASSLDYAATLQHVARLCVPELGDLCMVDVVQDGVLRRVATAHVSDAKRALVEQLAQRNPTPGGSPAPAGRVLASGETELLEVVTADVIASHTRDEGHARLIRAIGLRSHLAVPMRAHGSVVGVLSLGITESDRRYGADDRVLAEELARRAALAVENARLYASANHEIEQRRRIEAELRVSEARVRAITEQSPLSTQRLAPDGRTIGVNRAWEALWGLRLQDLHDYNVLTDPQLEAKGIAPLLRQAFAGVPTYLPTIAYDRRASVPAVDGAADPDPVRWVSAFAYPVRDDAGAIREVVLVHQDVTEARRAEAQLRESEGRLSRALAGGGMVVWDWDLVADRVACSSNAAALFGRDIGDADDFRATIHADDLPAVHAAAARAMATGVLEAVEYRLHPQGDGERWVASRGQVEYDDHGRPARMLGVTVDVTTRRQAEEATRVLADAGEILGQSLDYATTLDNLARVMVPRLADWFAVDLLDEDGGLQRVAVHHPDPARVEIARELFRRYPPRRGKGAWRVIETRQPEWTAEIAEDVVRANAVDGDHARMLLGLQLRSYIVVPLIARDAVIGALTLVQAESGRRYGAADVAFALDIARRAAVAVDNARLYEQLQAEHRRKDEFLATLAHELRNPLAPIRTGLALLQAAPDAASAAGTRRVMERQLAHMVRLIDDLLDLSRVTRGTIELQRRPVGVGGIVASALEASRPLIESAGVTLEVDVPEPDRVLEVDDTRLAQVVTNLLNNAARFTPAGGLVRLRVRQVADRLRFEVRDTGVGLDAAQREQIFEMFVRAHPGLAHGGLGIGLTLARRLVELHGGRLWAESEGPGHGSLFVAELPLVEPSRAADTGAPATTATLRPPRRVLVVDDNLDAAQTLCTLLEFNGHAVRTAASGDAAVALLDDFVPEIALLDIGLPGMSGYELAAHLRRDARTAAARLIAITGWGREEDRERAHAAGFDAHMTKPVDPDALFATLHG